MEREQGRRKAKAKQKKEKEKGERSEKRAAGDSCKRKHAHTFVRSLPPAFVDPAELAATFRIAALRKEA